MLEAGGVGEQEGRVEIVVDGDVDLAGAVAVGIDDESAGGAVAVGEIAVEEREPVVLGDGAGSGGVVEEFAGGEVGQHLQLGLVEHAGEVDFAGAGVTSHEFRIGEDLA